MESENEPRHLKKILLVGIGMLLAAFAFSVRNAVIERGWSGYLRLMRHGVTGQAVITRAAGKDCLAEYAYTVAGRGYLGMGAGGCNTGVGERVTVTYLVEDPSHSCIGSPGERLGDDVVSYYFGGLTFPSLQ